MDQLGSHMQIRQRVLSIFNKRRQDFETDREFNDYLEDIEDIKKKDVKETESRIAIYEAAHRDDIIANRVRQAEEAKSLADAAAIADAAAQAAAAGAPDQRAADVAAAPASAAALQTVAPSFAFSMDPRQQGALQPIPLGVAQHHTSGADISEAEARENDRKAALAKVAKHRALQEALSSLFL